MRARWAKRTAPAGLAALALALLAGVPQTTGIAAADEGDAAAGSSDQRVARAGRPAGTGQVGVRPGRTAGSDGATPRAPTKARSGAASVAALERSDAPLVVVDRVGAAEDDRRSWRPKPLRRMPETIPVSIADPVADLYATGTAPGPVLAMAAVSGPPESTLPPPASAVRANSADPVLRVVADLVGVLSGARAEPNPTAPVDSPISWTVLAGASRRTFAAAGPAATTAGSSTTPPLAIPQTPLVTALRLQEIPIIGPLLVTPVVTTINRIPVVSDLLHPIFGYPLLPAGLAAPRDVRVISFDRTTINVHFMPAADLRSGQTAPTVLLASALGMPGATNLDGTALDLILADFGGQIGVAALREAGYNVVTWDPRGEYFSGGILQMDSPEFEARDVSAIVNWVAEQPEVQLDGPGDPRMGMAGASYGGGIQLVAAATDHRIDAIVPTIAWNTLNGSIYESDAFKAASATLLAFTLVATLARFNAQILPIGIYGDFTGAMTEAGQDLLARSGPGASRGFPDLVNQITAPTLLIQGTVDTLFSLKEADLTATNLIAQGVPTKVIWFCGGHGLCIHNVFDLSDGAALQQRTVEWLDRYVKGESVSPGPGFEWVDQRGEHLSHEIYGGPSGDPIVAARTGDQVLPLIPFMGGSGPMFLVLPLGGTIAFNAINLSSPVSTTTTHIVGEPQLTLSYSGTGIGEHVYAQLVDDTTLLVVGNQVTPIPVILDGERHTTSIPLEPVAQTLRPGETVTVQLFSWSADHSANIAVGELRVHDIRITLPTNAVSSIR